MPEYGFDVELCEQYRDIDLDSFKQKGFLLSNCIGTLKWRRRDKVIATIDYRVERDGLRLMYRTRPRGGEWRDVNELIPFAEPTQFLLPFQPPAPSSETLHTSRHLIADAKA